MLIVALARIDSFFKNRTVRPSVPRETLGLTHYGIARRTHSWSENCGSLHLENSATHSDEVRYRMVLSCL